MKFRLSIDNEEKEFGWLDSVLKIQRWMEYKDLQRSNSETGRKHHDYIEKSSLERLNSKTEEGKAGMEIK